MNVVAVPEMKGFPGIEAIRRVLLTHLPVRYLASVAQKIAWYGIRWRIVTWHRVIKSGGKVEDRLPEKTERLQRYRTLCSISAARLIRVT